jgi:thiol-disulfide isomerase/thioredoxin
MRGLLVGAIAFLAAAFLLRFLMGQYRTEPERDPAVGITLMSIELSPLTGDAEKLSLGTLQGNVTLVNFWGTWCPPCRDELPELIEVYAKLRDKPGFAWVSISYPGDETSDEELRTNTEAFLKQRKITWPTHFDPGHRTAAAVTVAFDEPIGFPTTILFDRRGVIRGVWRGYRRGIGQEVEKLAIRLLNDD